MNQKLRKVLLVVLALGLVLGVWKVAQQMLSYRAAQQAYDQAEAIALGQTDGAASSLPEIQTEAEQPENSVPPETSPTEELDVLDELPRPGPEVQPEPTPEMTPTPTPKPTAAPMSTEEFLRTVNLDGLRAVNSEVVGWILIPGTGISYPLLQTADNQTYLEYAWNGRKTSAGSIFLECRSNAALTDFNTIIYGHYMRNGSMFAPLQKYKSQNYYESSPDVYLVTDGMVYRYRIFSSYEAPVESDTYRLIFPDDTARQSALDYYVESSVISTGLTPTVEDRILTLSTCVGGTAYSTRWVVQAVLAECLDRSSL